MLFLSKRKSKGGLLLFIIVVIILCTIIYIIKSTQETFDMIALKGVGGVGGGYGLGAFPIVKYPKQIQIDDPVATCTPSKDKPVVLDVVVTNTTSSTITIKWVALNHHFVNLKLADSVHAQNIPNSQNDYTFQNLFPDTEYKMTVVPYDTNNLLGIANSVLGKTKPIPPAIVPTPSQLVETKPSIQTQFCDVIRETELGIKVSALNTHKLNGIIYKNGNPGLSNVVELTKYDNDHFTGHVSSLEPNSMYNFVFAPVSTDGKQGDPSTLSCTTTSSQAPLALASIVDKTCDFVSDTELGVNVSTANTNNVRGIFFKAGAAGASNVVELVNSGPNKFSGRVRGLEPLSTYNFRFDPISASGLAGNAMLLSCSTNAASAALPVQSATILEKTCNLLTNSEIGIQLSTANADLVQGKYWKAGTDETLADNVQLTKVAKVNVTEQGQKFAGSVKGLAPGTTYKFKFDPYSNTSTKGLEATLECTTAPVQSNCSANYVPDTGQGPVGRISLVDENTTYETIHLRWEKADYTRVKLEWVNKGNKHQTIIHHRATKYIYITKLEPNTCYEITFTGLDASYNPIGTQVFQASTKPLNENLNADFVPVSKAANYNFNNIIGPIASNPTRTQIHLTLTGNYDWFPSIDHLEIKTIRSKRWMETPTDTVDKDWDNIVERDPKTDGSIDSIIRAAAKEIMIPHIPPNYVYRLVIDAVKRGNPSVRHRLPIIQAETLAVRDRISIDNVLYPAPASYGHSYLSNPRPYSDTWTINLFPSSASPQIILPSGTNITLTGVKGLATELTYNNQETTPMVISLQTWPENAGNQVNGWTSVVVKARVVPDIDLSLN